MIVVEPLLTISGAFHNRLLLLSAERPPGLTHCWMLPAFAKARIARLRGRGA